MLNETEMKTLIARDKAMMCAIIDGDYEVVITLAQQSKHFYNEKQLMNKLSGLEQGGENARRSNKRAT